MKQVIGKKKKIRNGNIWVQIATQKMTTRCFLRMGYEGDVSGRLPPAMLTLRAEWPRICREGAVTREPAELFSALPAIETQLPVAAAVPSTAGLHARGHLSPLFQVQGHPVQLQRPNAAQKAPLSGGRST